MTVKELIKELKKHPANAEVYYVADWDKLDEEDNTLTDIVPVQSVDVQVKYYDDGLDWVDVHEVLIGAWEDAR